MTDLAPTSQDREVIDRMAHVERQIVLGVRSIRTAWVQLAGLLYEFVQDRGWELLGIPSMEEWLAGPEIELGRTQVLRLVRVYRMLVVEHKVPVGELEGVSLSKADVVLAAIREGKVSKEEGLADCRELTREDVEAKYRHREPGAPLDPEGEPPLCECSRCGKVHRPKAVQT